MKKTTSSILLLLLLCSCVSAQMEYHNWFFGDHTGLDFTSGSPTVISNTGMYAPEGCSSISSANGTPLFYSNGVDVWNINHNIMPNGSGLTGCTSSTQSAFIIPNPTSTNIYYLFTNDCVENSGSSGFSFSVIDMSLDGGLGDVTIKNTQLFSPSSEKVAAVCADEGKNVWMITHGIGSAEFYSHLVTGSGVYSTPVVSNAGNPINTLTNGQGTLKASPDGTLLGMTRRSIQASTGFDLLHFDHITGTVSTYMSIPIASNQYDCEFSPNSNLLYMATEDTMYQYNLLAGTPTAIINSKIAIGTSTNTGRYHGIQLAPDGKIYTRELPGGPVPYLTVINNPDVIGVGCNYVTNGLSLNGNFCLNGLPPAIRGTCYTTTIEENSVALNWSLSPNPFSTATTLTFDNPLFDEHSFVLYNSQGKLVKYLNNIATNQIIIEREHLATGLYHFQLINTKKTIASGQLMIY
jgi:hypothetical protein